MDDAIQILIRRYEKLINHASIPIALERDRLSVTGLMFPGKIFATARELIISDSNHNQIFVSDHSGLMREIIGKGTAGTRDGDFKTVEFHRPQGIFKSGDLVYVADTENHLIREINLTSKTVRTIAGTGARGSFLSAGGSATQTSGSASLMGGGSAAQFGGHGRVPALKTALNSPWDLMKVEDALYIAMAGAHQIWKLNLQDGTLELFAGSGREDIVDGPGESSALAQPSGITFDGKEYLYFADSEVSAVRRVHLKTRQVETLIGHGLFDFGDQDGSWRQALLQHPLGVHYLNDTLYVADTYNDKIKRIDLAQKTITTLAGSGEEKLLDGKPGALYEPGGIGSFGNQLFIADTNNHTIRVFDLATRKLDTLQIQKQAVSQSFPHPSPLPGGEGRVRGNPFLQKVDYPKEILLKNAQISVSVVLPPNHEFTENFSLDYQVKIREGTSAKDLKIGSLAHPEHELPIRFALNSVSESEFILEAELNISYCTTAQPKLCKFKTLQLIQPITLGAAGKANLNLQPKIQG